MRTSVTANWPSKWRPRRVRCLNIRTQTYIDTLAGAYAECGDREGTLKWSKKITELSPDFTVQYYNAMRFLWCGSVDEYRHTCAAMIKESATETDDAARYWVAWTCALSPGASDDLSVPQKFAEEIVKHQPKNATYLNVLGMLEYRTGHFEEAARQLTTAMTAAQNDKTQKTSPLYSQFFLAMADWQLGQKDEARQLLKDAQAGMDQVMKSPPAWNRRATLELFRHEAEALIQPAETSVD